MDIYDALAQQDWDAMVEALPHGRGMSLLHAVTEVDGGDVESPRPAGLWHVAAVRHNTLTPNPAVAAPLGPAARENGAALREALIKVAAGATLAKRVAKRAFSDLGFLVVRPDGLWQSVSATDEVGFAGEGDAPASTLPFDLLDRLEREAQASADGWRGPVDAPADGTDALGRWATGGGAVLSFARAGLDAELGAHLASASLEGAMDAAGLVRHTPRELVRTLYAGDFLGDAPPTKIEIVLLMHRRLWVPPRRET